MREWIEMQAFSGSPIGCIVVLPRMREWIEILILQKILSIDKRSPSYEGVDWNKHIGLLSFNCSRSPSYEGVDWNTVLKWDWVQKKSVLPRMREWIEIDIAGERTFRRQVLPRMREWIEIKLKSTPQKTVLWFSLVWGSGLKLLRGHKIKSTVLFSLVWGSGLKYPARCRRNQRKCSPSYEGVDWNKMINDNYDNTETFSLVWGSGLKYQNRCRWTR